MAYNITKMSSPSTIKKIFFAVVIIACMIVIQNLIRSIYDLWNKQDLVIKAQKDLDREKQEYQRLKAQLTFVKSEEFIEEEARNNLFLVKPGESEVIVPEELIKKRRIKDKPETPNWQKWINLLIEGN